MTGFDVVEVQSDEFTATAKREHALVLADANFDQHLAYATASRALAKTHLFIDGASVDAIETDLSTLGPLTVPALTSRSLLSLCCVKASGAIRARG